MKLKNYIVTHLPTDSTRRHVGFEPTHLSSGEISTETCAEKNYTPPLEWTPSAEWRVDEDPAKTL